MKKFGLKKKKWMAVVTIALTAVFVFCYWPFVQMKDFVTEKYKRSILDETYHDNTEDFFDFIEIYPLCWFIHKGDTYSDIPFLYNDTIHKHKMDIKFNWDNSVTISEGDHKHDIHVNKVLIEPKLYPFSDNDYPFKHHETYDSLFVGIFMIDNSKNEIDIYRQKSSMPYKGRRVGFRIVIDGKVYVTEGKERFNY